MQTRNEKTQATSGSSNLGHLADPAHGTLVLLLVFGAGERTGKARGAAVDGSIRGSTDVEFCKRIEFDFDLVLRVALALSFDFAGLIRVIMSVIIRALQGSKRMELTCSRSLGEPPLASSLLAKLRADA